MTLTGDFMLDYDEGDDKTTVTAFRDERSVSLEIKPVLDGDRLTGHETSVVYGVFMHSVERRRAGYTGILAGDTHERTVVNATVEDVITALQWLVGKTS